MKTLGHKTDAYYKFHARIYDLTRWAFLFGRASMVKEIAKLKPRSVLEVGCGTGRNLIELKELDLSIHCYGLDSSKDMLEVAKVDHSEGSACRCEKEETSVGGVDEGVDVLNWSFHIYRRMSSLGGEVLEFVGRFDFFCNDH